MNLVRTRVWLFLGRKFIPVVPDLMETTRSSGARLCQLWLHCAAVGRWKGHLRPHFDKVWANKQIAHWFEFWLFKNAHCVPLEPTMSLSCISILISLPQAQGAGVQCGILPLRQVPCQRQLWQVRISFHRPTYSAYKLIFTQVCPHLEHSERPAGSLLQGHWRHLWGVEAWD